MSRCKSKSPGIETFITVMAVLIPGELVKESGTIQRFSGEKMLFKLPSVDNC